MIKLKNIIYNSSFNELKYDEDKRIIPIGWSDVYTYNNTYNINYDEDLNKNVNYKICGILDSKNAYHGDYSLKLTNKLQTRESVTSNTINTKFSVESGHVYYMSCYTLYSHIDNENNNDKVTMSINNCGGSTLHLQFDKEWTRQSMIFTPGRNTRNTSYVNIKTENTVDNNNEYSIDALMLIDLTKHFGALGIPSKEWCDKNIPYFEDEYTFNEIKEIKFLNLNDFAFNEKTHLYYNNENKVKFIFSIKDFDLDRYNNDIPDECKLRYILLEKYHDSNEERKTIVYFGDNNFNTSHIISQKNNITVFEILVDVDINSNEKQLQIIGDNALYGDSVCIYTVFNWKNTFPLEKHALENISIVSDTGKYSQYEKIISGTLNPFVLSPCTVEIYVNNYKIKHIDYNYNDYEPSTFKTVIFFKQNENTLTINVKDIFGNIICTDEKIITINTVESLRDRYELLTNFVGNEDQMIQVYADETKLKYTDESVGYEKPLSFIDSSIHNYFHLSGTNSHLYRLDTKHTPKIISDIIPRSIGVNFNRVEKIYDGNNDITKEVNKFVLNDGYRFINSDEKYYDYTNNGLITGYVEDLEMETIIGQAPASLKKYYHINTLTVIIDTLQLFLDNYKGHIQTDNTIEFDEVLNRFNNIIKINNKEEFKSIKENKNSQILAYCIYQNDYLDDKNWVAEGIDYNPNIDKFETFKYESGNKTDNERLESETKVIEWLKAIDNSLLGAKVYKNNEGEYIIETILVDNSSYKIKDKFTIKYKYKSDIDKTFISFQESDENLVKIKFDNATFDSKDVTESYEPIKLSNIELIGTNDGDASINYQISNYSIEGKIIKRGVIAFIKIMDKVYDGTSFAPFTMSNVAYHGLEGSIEGDDVFIDDTFHGYPLDNFHHVTKLGNSIIQYKDENVGDNKELDVYHNNIKGNYKSIMLEGKDANNYELIYIQYERFGSILPRTIEVIIDRLRYIRSTSKWEVDYHFINDIKTDNLKLSYNVNNERDFIVYGGVFSEDEIQYDVSNLTDYNGLNDIKTMFFNYPKNYNYKYEEIDTEIYVPTNTDLLYGIDKNEIAQSNFKKIDTAIINTSNSGMNIEFKATDYPYYESQDKKYRLYNGQTVVVTNLFLDDKNIKSQNYILQNTTCKTILEIV